MRVDLSDKNVLRYATIFLYPFYYSPDKKSVLNKLVETQKWKAEKFDINRKEKYREYVFFHPYIRDIFFHQEGSPHEFPVTYLRYQHDAPLVLNVKYPQSWEDRSKYVSASERSYPIDSIQISLFDFGIGVLVIQIEDSLQRKDYESLKFKEVLCFNEMARRIAPSFHPEEQKKAGILLDSISIVGIEDSQENFRGISNLIKDRVVEVSKTIQTLLHPLVNCNIFEEKNTNNEHYCFQTALDERMVVYSYVCLDTDEMETDEIMLADEDFLTFALIDKAWEGSFSNKDLIQEYLKSHAYEPLAKV